MAAYARSDAYLTAHASADAVTIIRSNFETFNSTNNGPKHDTEWGTYPSSFIDAIYFAFTTANGKAYGSANTGSNAAADPSSNRDPNPSSVGNTNFAAFTTANVTTHPHLSAVSTTNIATDVCPNATAKCIAHTSSIICPEL